jgi:hypothetical protein
MRATLCLVVTLATTFLVAEAGEPTALDPAIQKLASNRLRVRPTPRRQRVAGQSAATPLVADGA